MKLLITGCEYSGTTTLTKAICEWGESTIGGQWGDGHDHFNVPHLSHPPDLTPEEQAQILALSPRVMEIFQRYNIEYHLQPSLMHAPHHILMGMHIDEAVYAPQYYGYGREGEYAARSEFARHVEERIMRYAPDFVHVLVKASPEVIAARMQQEPHVNPVLKEQDVELVLRRFEEEYEASRIRNKVAIDTSTSTVQESLDEFVRKIEPFITDADKAGVQ